MIALEKDIKLLQRLFYYIYWITLVFKMNLKAKRAELVDSGELDPNISRRERLSKEPSLSLTR